MFSITRSDNLDYKSMAFEKVSKHYFVRKKIRTSDIIWGDK